MRTRVCKWHDFDVSGIRYGDGWQFERRREPRGEGVRNLGLTPCAPYGSRTPHINHVPQFIAETNQVSSHHKDNFLCTAQRNQLGLSAVFVICVFWLTAATQHLMYLLIFSISVCRICGVIIMCRQHSSSCLPLFFPPYPLQICCLLRTLSFLQSQPSCPSPSLFVPQHYSPPALDGHFQNTEQFYSGPCLCKEMFVTGNNLLMSRYYV